MRALVVVGGSRMLGEVLASNMRKAGIGARAPHQRRAKIVRANPDPSRVKPDMFRGQPNGTLRVMLAIERHGPMTSDHYAELMGRGEHQRFADADALGYITAVRVGFSKRGKNMDVFALTEKGRTKMHSIRMRSSDKKAPT